MATRPGAPPAGIQPSSARTAHLSTAPLRLGTRGSRLALWQAHTVRDLLAALPGAPPVEIVEIVTSGDRIQHVALSQVGGTNFFTKDIEDALLAEQVDLAVHSFKDLATDEPRGLGVCAVLERADPRDALVAPAGSTLASLPAGAAVGTSSLRRKAFLAAARADLETRELRGNVPTRLRKFQDGQYDALLLATAGLERLGLGEHIAERIDPDVLTPAPAQGAVAIQTRVDDARTRSWVERINHPATLRATAAERRFLNVVEGGCQAPVGALARPDGDALVLHARVAALDGTRTVHGVERGPASDPEALGERLANRLLAEGAEAILDEIRRSLPS